MERAVPLAKEPLAVWAGDVVGIEAEPRFPIAAPIWLPVIVFSVLVGLLIWRPNIEEETGFPVLVMVIAAVAGIGVWTYVRVRAAYWKRRLDRMDASPPDNVRSLAWRLWHRGLLRKDDGSAFDAATFIERTGEEGARVITVGWPLPGFQPDAQLFEEVSVGADRALGDAERKMRRRQALGMGAGLIMLIVMWKTLHASSPIFLVIGGIYAITVATALYRLGVRPIQLGRASAVVGSIRVASLASNTEFNRANSVLILHPRNQNLIALAVRSDGEFARLTFHNDPDDPGIRELLSRWCWRGGLATPNHIAVQLPARPA